MPDPDPAAASRLRRAERPQRPVRRWPRRMLLSINVLVAVLLVGAGSVYGYARYRLSSIHTAKAPALSNTPTGQPTTDGLAPENILLIGNETRQGLPPSLWSQFGSAQVYTGSLSDVIMILHLDPRSGTASILSIPRDLLAHMPVGSKTGPWEKIDAALNDGANGPNNLIAAIHQDFGIPINHFAELNFLGFERTVNALGGIRMDFPERLFDGVSLLNVPKTGCQLVTGSEALALVRSRHLQYDPPGVDPNAPVVDTANGPQREGWPFDPESDLARIVRDHEFLRVLIDTAQSQGLTNPFKANAFIGAVIDQVTMDPGLRDQLVTLATHYRHINAAALPETTLPVTTVNDYYYGGYQLGDVDFPVQPADTNVIRAWDQGALPTPQAPASVQVYNAVGSATLAADTGAALSTDGLHVTLEADAPVEGNPTETIVRYHPGQLAEGYDVFRQFSGAITMQSDPTVPVGTVVVDVGTTESVAGSVSTAANSVPETTAPATAPPTTAPAAKAPTTGGPVNPAADQLTPYDPRPC